MQKKILLSLISIVAVGAGVVGMSAFEAHVINVTAHIENALYVPVEAAGLSFGTIFPEEVLYKNFDFRLSDSFMAEDRVDDVEYVLRQKPKCGVPVPNTDPVEYTEFVQVTDGPNGTFICPAESVMLPLLCPYLSKAELDASGKPTDNEIPAFHGPLTNWTMDDTIETQLIGRLSKADKKTSVSWMLDLHAPCFKGMCAQDNVIPANYQADPRYESQLFGCDLWIEVTNISLPRDKALLTVIKHVINDSGTGSSTASDFTMNVTGTNVSDPTFPGAESPGTDVTLDAGLYSVDETGPVGYTKTLGAGCSGTIAIGDHKFCTITNDDIPPEVGDLTVIKVVVNNGVGTKVAADFQMTIDGGNVAQDTAIPVSAGSHTVSEANNFGYVVSFSGDCNSSGVVNVGNGENKNCTVTNTMPFGTITATKAVTNDDGGLLTIGSFTLKIDGITVSSGVSKNVSVGPHNVSEIGVFGYSAKFTGDCNTSGNVTVAAGENKSCLITNDDIAPSIELVKNVVGGSALPDDFDLSIDGNIVTSGSSNSVMANIAHAIDEEVMVSGYSFTSITGTSFKGVPCPAALEGTITLLPGDVVTCTITNTKP